MLSVSGLTSTSWVIAVSSDDGGNDGCGGGGQQTQHIRNERGGRWGGEGNGLQVRGEDKMRELKVELKD